MRFVHDYSLTLIFIECGTTPPQFSIAFHASLFIVKFIINKLSKVIFPVITSDRRSDLRAVQMSSGALQLDISVELRRFSI